MSHRASNWLADLPADAMNASSFRVLFHLANAHNSLRDPGEACFPQQAALLKATGLSNGGLNNALNALEAADLIRRVASTDHDGRRRTYYILGCDFGLIKEQTPNNGDRANSNLNGTKLQSARIPNSNSVEFDTNAEPVREPVKEPVMREAALSLFPEQENLPAKEKATDRFSEFWEAYPNKAAKPAAQKNFAKAIKDGADPDRIIEGARRYAKWLSSAKPGEFRPHAKYPQGWLTERRWDDAHLWEADQEDDETAAYRARMRAITESAQRAYQRP
jgi:hypothetical protein